MDDPVLAQLIAQFAAADCCWFSSTRPDGRAHLAPLWHVWHEGRAYMVTQPSAVRARNIAHQPAVSLALPDAINALIIEGDARFSPEQQAALNPLFKAKYNWEFVDDATYNVIIEVTPRKMMAWGNHGEGRWHFDADGTLLAKGADKGDAA